MKQENNYSILILSYHYLPLNVIASYRPRGYAEQLNNYGIYPTMVTHIWERDRNNNLVHFQEPGKKPVIESVSTHRIIRIPKVQSTLGKIHSFFAAHRVTRKLGIVISWMLGHLDTTPEQLDSYRSFKKFAFRHLQEEKYDMIMGIYSPHHHLKLCYKLNKKFGVPYVLDFRDIWNNMAVDSGYQPTGENLIKEHFVKRYWKRWLSRASFYSTVSDSWVRKMEEITPTRGVKVMHGFDDDIAVVQKTNPADSDFIVLYSGSLYKNQDLDGFLDGARQFVNQVNPVSFKLVFLGSLREELAINSPFVQSLDKKIADYLPKKNFLVTKRVSREKVIEYYKNASILLNLTYRYMSGTFSGKFFEYVGTLRPILVYPNDQGEICSAVSEGNLGIVVNSAVEISKYLERIYRNWEEKKYTKVDSANIYKYSRSYQVAKLSEHIKQAIGCPTTRN